MGRVNGKLDAVGTTANAAQGEVRGVGIRLEKQVTALMGGINERLDHMHAMILQRDKEGNGSGKPPATGPSPVPHSSAFIKNIKASSSSSSSSGSGAGGRGVPGGAGDNAWSTIVRKSAVKKQEGCSPSILGSAACALPSPPHATESNFAHADELCKMQVRLCKLESVAKDSVSKADAGKLSSRIEDIAKELIDVKSSLCNQNRCCD